MAIEPLAAPSAGMNTESSPDYVEKNRAPLLENFLPGRSGKIVMRGPLNERAEVYASSPQMPRGLWRYGDKVAMTRTGSSTVSVATPSTAAVATATLTISGLDDLTPATSGPGGFKSFRFGDMVYGLTSASSNGPYVGRWNGGSLAASFTTYSAPYVRPSDGLAANSSPFGCADIASHLRRLFVLCNRPAGEAIIPLTSTNPNWLCWSDIDGPTTDVVAEWSDDASGLVNKLAVPVNDDDVCVALARVGGSLAILSRRGVYMLLGDTPATFQIRLLTSNYGCTDVESVAEVADGFYFMSGRGLVFCDGHDVMPVSEPIRSDLLIDTAGSQTHVRPLKGGLILVTVSTAAVNYLFDPRSGAWVTLSTDAAILPSGRFYTASTLQTGEWGFDGRALWSLDDLDPPEMAAASTRGFDNNSGTKAFIPAKWYSRLARLSTPLYKAVVRQLSLDYAFAVDGAVAEGDGWYASVLDGTGSTVLAEVQIPSQLDPATQLYRRRYVIDVNGEASDVQLRVVWKGVGTPPALEIAEIYDCGVEYETAQRQR
jgi:hypothetical protein